MSDDPYELYCPNCGHDGAFDGRGSFVRKTKHYQNGGQKVNVTETWAVFGCSECGTEFAKLDDKKELLG